MSNVKTVGQLIDELCKFDRTAKLTGWDYYSDAPAQFITVDGDDIEVWISASEK